MEPKSAFECRDEVQFVDVREDWEWVAGRIEGAAHVPLTQLPERLPELPMDRPLVVVCRSGQRSEFAAQWLTSQGLQAHNLEGGMKEWARAGLPYRAADGTKGSVV